MEKEKIVINVMKIKTRAPVTTQSTNIPHVNKKKYKRKGKHKEDFNGGKD